MASGDRSRTWFPEMIERLRKDWRGDLDMAEVIALAQRLDRMLQEIRTERAIKPAMFRCPQCGRRSPEGPRRVSVRAMILAAGRFGSGDTVDVKRIERLWRQHRSAEKLDLYGSPEAADRREPHSCTGHASHAGQA